MSDSEKQNWLYSKDGISSEGPFTLQDLKSFYQKGAINEHTLVTERDIYATRLIWRRAVHLLAESKNSTIVPTSLGALLKEYEGALVGVNGLAPNEFTVAKLLRLAEDYISLDVRSGPGRMHFPFQHILSVVENSHMIEAKVFMPAHKASKDGILFKMISGEPKAGSRESFPGLIQVPLLIVVAHNAPIPNSGGLLVGVSVPI